MSIKDLIDPLALAWLFLVAAVSLRLIRKKDRSAWKWLILLILVPVMELTALPARMVASMEAPYRPSGELLPAAGSLDAVVVCGGILSGSPDDFSGADYGARVDRFLTGVEMARRLRLPLVLGGGFSQGKPESEYLGRWLTAWNAAPLDIHQIPECADTREEAVRTAELAARRGWKRILLVTSAWHLPRAAAAFRQTGLSVATRGCDFEGTVTASSPGVKFLPSCGSACLLRCWITENAGRFYYYCRGWI